MLGWPLALLLGNFAAGWLNQLYGWRVTLVIVGMPGLLLAALAWLTLKEPRNFTPAKSGGSEILSHQPPVGAVLRDLWSNRAFRLLLFCFSLSYFFGNGILQWQPVFFVRSHGMTTGELGTWFAIIYGVGGLFGTWLGGELSLRYAASNERLQFIAMALVFGIMAVAGSAVYGDHAQNAAFAALTVSAIGGAALNGPIFAATQTLVPPSMRAMSVAVVLFFSNLIGLGLGPLAVGALSDALEPWFANESLRYALLALCPGYLVCAALLLRASRLVPRYIAAAQQLEDRATARG
jgi:MFS family permease